MRRPIRPTMALLALLGSGLPAGADPQLADFEYPYAVNHYDFQSQGRSLEMAFMDIEPRAPNGRTIVLLHGKNFCAATWDASILPLSEAGYRVVVPEQIGFFKSSKPEAYQLRLTTLESQKRELLNCCQL